MCLTVSNLLCISEAWKHFPSRYSETDFKAYDNDGFPSL